MEDEKVYIAGPFFNGPQLEHVQMVEKVLIRHRIPFFSPRAAGGGPKPTKTKADRQDIIKSNVEEINGASLVLALVDWLNPPDLEVRVVKRGLFDVVAPVSPPLNIPDVGTVWEAGFAYGTEVPIVGFALRTDGKINVMLAETFEGTVYGYDGLEDFSRALARGSISSAEVRRTLSEWKGGTA